MSSRSHDRAPSALPPAFVQAVTDALGKANVLADPEVIAGRCVDWTGRFHGHAPLVLCPSSTEEVAAIVAAARTSAVALVPQGGNTGLVGGATPCDGEVLVDLRRLHEISDVDRDGGQLTAGAGASIAAVQAAAREAGWAYGVDWAARDSATIGGSVATDAGGLRFVRHGSTRRQLLGVAAVLGTGVTATHLPAVQKDNTGYDLAALLCGSEGTLGLVTAVRVRLVAPPVPVATALVAFSSVHAAVDAAHELRRNVSGLEAVEFMVAAGMALVSRVQGLRLPFADVTGVAAILLVEVGASTMPEAALAQAVGGLGGVVEAAVAVDSVRRRELWRWRELHTESIGRVGVPHKLDVTLPAGELAPFVEDVASIVASVDPAATTWCFGHAADGNVHVNVTGIGEGDERVDAAVFSEVAARGGSISAEHGIGRAKRRWLHLAHEPGSIAAMHQIKDALDPDHVLNPGVLLPER